MTHVCDFCGRTINHANDGHVKGCGRASPEPLPPVTEPPPVLVEAPPTPRRDRPA